MFGSRGSIISDKFIPKGDFIVEYRGVIIDNKEADRSENDKLIATTCLELMMIWFVTGPSVAT